MFKVGPCLSIAVLTAIGWFGNQGLAKKDWIYKELRRESETLGFKDPHAELLNVP